MSYIHVYVVYQVTIGEGSHPENVKVYGPGVENTGLKANEPTYFTVDCSEAGQGETWSKMIPASFFFGLHGLKVKSKVYLNCFHSQVM